MILRYYDRHFAEQCEIAEFARVNNPTYFGDTNCCLDPDVDSDLDPDIRCNRPNFLWGEGSIEDILYTHGLETNVHGSELSFNECRDEIDSSNPFVIRWGWHFGGGHVIVCRGYHDVDDTANDMLYIVDPWPGEGPQLRTYASVLNPPGGTWTHTLTTNQHQGNNSVTLYMDIELDDDRPKLDFLASSYPYVGDWFNDHTSSARVRGMPFLLYQHANYEGYGWALTPRDYMSFADWGGKNDAVSSLRYLPGAFEDLAIILFEHTYFRGKYRIIKGDASNLGDFNDKVSSMVVISKIWRLHEHSNYAGRQYAVTSFGGPSRDGFYPYPSSWGGRNDEISSVYWVPESWDPIILYEHSDLRGRAVVLNRYSDLALLNNLFSLAFNDVTSSIKTYGDTWTVFRHSHQRGNSYNLNANTWYRHPKIWNGTNDSISSLRYTASND
jgi:hypothetical protein